MTVDPDLARLLSASPAPTTCKACGKATLRPVGRVDFNRVEAMPPPFPVLGIGIDHWQCDACGFAWAPVFDAWSDQDFARHIYNADIALTETAENATQRCANVAAMLRVWFAGSAADSRFLDYGCGPGLLVDTQRAQGYAAEGYDRFNPRFAARPEGRFDVVTCFEVMEHLKDIDAAVDDLVSFLAPDGILVIGTFLAARPLDLHWWYCSPRSGHICFWTFPALSAVFNKRTLNVAGDGKLFSFVFPDAAKDRVMKIFAPR